MVTDKELISDAVKRINNKLKRLKTDTIISVDTNRYAFYINNKEDTTFESSDYLIAYLDGFEAALEGILKSK